MRIVATGVVMGLVIALATGCAAKPKLEASPEIAATKATETVWELAPWDSDPSKWIPLPVGSVYGTPELDVHDDGSVTVTLMAWGVRFTDHGFTITDDRDRDVPVLSSRTDEHRQVRENDGSPRERLLSVWIGELRPEPDAAMLNVSITPTEEFSYSVKWDAIPLDFRSGIH